MLRKVRELHEVNPMLGHRGVRLGITFPEIYRMQIRAILEATADCQKAGINVNPEIINQTLNGGGVFWMYDARWYLAEVTLDVKEHTLANGMRILMVPKPGVPGSSTSNSGSKSSSSSVLP